MIFAATSINWLSLSISTLLVIFVIVCILMAVVVLIQRPKQDGLGAAFGGGVTDQLFGARSTDVFQKATWVLGTLFFLLCFTLMILISKQNKHKKKSLLNEKATAEKVEKIPEPVVVPTAPPTPPPSLATELPVNPTPAPAPETTPAPVAPTTPPAETPAPPAPQN